MSESLTSVYAHTYICIPQYSLILTINDHFTPSMYCYETRVINYTHLCIESTFSPMFYTVVGSNYKRIAIYECLTGGLYFMTLIQGKLDRDAINMRKLSMWSHAYVTKRLRPWVSIDDALDLKWCTLVMALGVIFTGGQFLSSGVAVACVSLCPRTSVCPCINHELVRANTRQLYNLEPLNSEKTLCTRFLFIFGVDWLWSKFKFNF